MARLVHLAWIERYAGGRQLPSKFRAPGQSVTIRHIDYTLEVRGPLDAAIDQGDNPVGAEFADKEAHLQNDILPSSRVEG